ncbi:MAG: hypothetical protein DI603_18240 [Roseateles depolymerans]|uniref:Uncharacterized protein n=1 Tax=Roseateles depolymerans TaxID=76731 RepID=A0A2W5DGM4_9BURK|nr:MAG: hypothetical protein DI603_18240 [Roseateles depolymerans]
MSADQTTATDPRTGPWRVQSSVWHKGTGSAYVMTTPADRKQRGALVARVYLTHPDGECDAARAILATLAAQVAAAPVLIAALRMAVGSGSLPTEIAQAARDALAAAGG